MSEGKRPSRFGRTMAVLVVVALGALAVTPAYSVFTPTKAQIRRIAKAEATKVVKQLGPKLFVTDEETILFHFGMDVGDPDRTMGPYGPFTFKATCTQPASSTEARLLIATSEENSIFNTNDWYEDDFDPGDGFVQWLLSDGAAPGGGQYDPRHDMIGHAASAGGTGLTAFTAIYNNVGGYDCVFQGNIVVTGRTA